MIQVDEIAFVGYPARDRAKAKQFYEGLLNLKPTQEQELGDDKFWIEYDIGPGTFALSNYWEAGDYPRPGPSAGLEVRDFDASIAILKDAGVTFHLEPMETPICHLALVADPDGNCLFIHKRKLGN
jgi:predicted enzyme related to lactoylglutathione lyase